MINLLKNNVKKRKIQTCEGCVAKYNNWKLWLSFTESSTTGSTVISRFSYEKKV